MKPCIITCAITGAEVTKDQNPAVPYTVDEIVNEAFGAIEEGASIIHLHARENNGKPSSDIAIFKEIIDKIQQTHPDVIIQVTTGGAASMTIQERAKVLELPIEMATLDCGTLNFGDSDIFVNRIEDIRYLADIMNQRFVKYELECFEKGHIDTVKYLIKKGVITKPFHFSFVLGVLGGMTGEYRDFLFMKESLPDGATYSVAGIGKYEFPLALHSIQNGGHVRVGLEDNLYIEKGILAKSNKELVRKVKMMIIENNRSVSTPQETRQILGMEN